MATFTENYNLIKPDEADYYDVTDFNENMDTLDAAMASVETAAAEISEKLGTPAEEGQTVFSLLAQGGSVIRSIQRVTITSPDKTVSINTVDPEKCVVLVERLYNLGTNLLQYGYTLSEDKITMTKIDSTSKSCILGFTVVEFV